MRTQPHRTHRSLATVAGSVLILALVAVLLPRADWLWSISSSEVDDLLYRNLDEYQDAIDRSEELQIVMGKALSAPGTLTSEEIETYVAHERRFFNGWEMVFNYGEGGYLAEDRFRVWDNWYRTEMERRPGFAWLKNKPAYSVAFATHVEGFAVSESIQLSECGSAAAVRELSGTMTNPADKECGTRTPANNR